MKIRIDRKMWLRGFKNSSGDIMTAVLFKKDQNAGCCLGHFIHQTTKCGWSKLNNLSTPEDYYTKANKKNPLVYKVMDDFIHRVSNSRFTRGAMKINDNQHISDQKREENLKALFLEYGYTLEFYN